MISAICATCCCSRRCPDRTELLAARPRKRRRSQAAAEGLSARGPESGVPDPRRPRVGAARSRRQPRFLFEAALIRLAEPRARSVRSRRFSSRSAARPRRLGRPRSRPNRRAARTAPARPPAPPPPRGASAADSTGPDAPESASDPAAPGARLVAAVLDARPMVGAILAAGRVDRAREGPYRRSGSRRASTRSPVSSPARSRCGPCKSTPSVYSGAVSRSRSVRAKARQRRRQRPPRLDRRERPRAARTGRGPA